MDRKSHIVLELCPDIVPIRKYKDLANLKYVLENESVIRKVGHEWHTRTGEKRFVFQEKPTEEYLQRLQNSSHDLRRHFAAVNDLLQRVLAVTRNAQPFRDVTVIRPDPPCKNCGKTEYINCTTHYTCKNCAVTRVKLETGLDYRNIKQRSAEQGDRNSCNWHVLDPTLSDAFNRQTVVGVAPGDNPVSIRNLGAIQKRANNKTAEQNDQQIIKAKLIIEDICEDLFLNASVQRKAYLLFCSFVRSQSSLPREKEIIAACLFHALPPKPKVYQKKKKRKLSPFNDTKKKRLRFMKF